MTNFASVFVGVPQSRYAALAILLAIIVVSLVILFSKDTIPVGQKLGFVFLVFLVSLPGIALSLFQLTCIVTGAGFKNKRWWCSSYAWIISAMMIFYAILLIFAAVTSLTAPTPSTPAKKLTPQQFNGMMQSANSYAASTMSSPGKEHMNDQATSVSDSYPNNQNPVKTVPGQMYKPTQMTDQSSYGVDQMSNPYEMFSLPRTDNFINGDSSIPGPFPGKDNFVVNGESSVPGPFPGNEKKSLTYAPGASINGQELPLPNSGLTEKFYAPVKFNTHESVNPNM